MQLLRPRRGRGSHRADPPAPAIASMATFSANVLKTGSVMHPWVSATTAVLVAALACQPVTRPTQRPAPGPAAGARGRSAAATDRAVDSVLARMTLEEKLGQLTQVPGPGSQTGPAVRAGTETEIR